MNEKKTPARVRAKLRADLKKIATSGAHGDGLLALVQERISDSLEGHGVAIEMFGGDPLEPSPMLVPLCKGRSRAVAATARDQAMPGDVGIAARLLVSDLYLSQGSHDATAIWAEVFGPETFALLDAEAWQQLVELFHERLARWPDRARSASHFTALCHGTVFEERMGELADTVPEYLARCED